MAYISPLTGDIQNIRYGSPIDHQPIEGSVGKGASGQSLYRGSFAMISGGTTVTQGYLKNASSGGTAGDTVVGLVEGYGPSCGQPNTGPGIGGATLNTADGALTANVKTGTFLMQAGSGADALTIANLQTTVYVINESTVGATAQSRAKAGLLVQVPATDASIPTGFVAVSIGSNNGPWGGV